MKSRSLVSSCVLILIALFSTLLPAEGVFIYVSKTGSSISPYGSWATAATSLHAAVSVATDFDQILISNGTFAVTGTVEVGRPVTIRSMNGPLFTTIDGGYPVRTNRCFHISHYANLEGLTIKNGHAGDLWGGGVWRLSGRRDQQLHIYGQPGRLRRRGLYKPRHGAQLHVDPEQRFE